MRRGSVQPLAHAGGSIAEALKKRRLTVGVTQGSNAIMTESRAMSGSIAMCGEVDGRDAAVTGFTTKVFSDAARQLCTVRLCCDAISGTSEFKGIW